MKGNKKNIHMEHNKLLLVNFSPVKMSDWSQCASEQNNLPNYTFILFILYYFIFQKIMLVAAYLDFHWGRFYVSCQSLLFYKLSQIFNMTKLHFNMFTGSREAQKLQNDDFKKKYQWLHFTRLSVYF